RRVGLRLGAWIRLHAKADLPCLEKQVEDPFSPPGHPSSEPTRPPRELHERAAVEMLEGLLDPAAHKLSGGTEPAGLSERLVADREWTDDLVDRTSRVVPPDELARVRLELLPRSVKRIPREEDGAEARLAIADHDDLFEAVLALEIEVLELLLEGARIVVEAVVGGDPIGGRSQHAEATALVEDRGVAGALRSFERQELAVGLDVATSDLRPADDELAILDVRDRAREEVSARA